MLEGLDPHSTFLNEKDFKDLQIGTKGEFGGLGIEITMEGGYVKVITPIDDNYNLNDYFIIDKLEIGQFFLHRKKDIFRKVSKKRKRYVCEKISNGKLYLFQPNTLVLDYNNEKI